MHRRTGAARLATAAFASVLVAACGSSSITIIDEGPAIAEEHLPLHASFDLRGDPPVAIDDLHLEVVVLPEEISLRSIDITAGTTVRWHELLSEGPIRLVSTTPPCTWELALPPEENTPIVFHHEADPCWFEISDPVESGEAGFLSAAVTVQPWDGLLVEAFSLDTPLQPVPIAVPPDEGGLAQLGPLWPGRYDIVLRRGERVLERRTIDVHPTGPQDSTIVITLDGVPD